MLCIFLNIFFLIYLDIAKPRLQKILPILFALLSKQKRVNMFTL